MTATAANSFLSLSPSLRLEVYRHLMIDALTPTPPQANPSPTHIGALYLTCRLINHEMEEFISRGRGLLNALHT
jgi:hypothetical protein